MTPPGGSPEPVRVLIVEDSPVIRTLLKRALSQEPGIAIAAMAGNAREALAQLETLPVDIILLDVEMPDMDGVTALPKLLRAAPGARVIMVSSVTLHNAEISLRALEAGACDYIAKPAAGDKDEVPRFYKELIRKIYILAPIRLKDAASVPPPVPPMKPRLPSLAAKAVAIGCSTGGPQALAKLFGALAEDFPPVPIFITQHMPPAFTTVMAEHIAQISGRPCREGKEGEEVRPGTIYIAPGDFHMVPAEREGKIVIRINQAPPINYCRPSVDAMLGALSKSYGKRLLAVILTGMGSDGLEGARATIAAGGTVAAQDETSSVVWGMPRAVAESGVASAILSIDALAAYIRKACT